MMSWLMENWPLLIAALWAAERLANIVARLTPSEKDDALVAKARGWLEKLASLGLKPPPSK